jgi:transposase
MSTPLLPHTLWNLIQPLLPPSPHRPKGGRPRLPDRACLTGILFVLRSGIPWEMLPQELGCGSGMTCWRRLRDWQEAGIWQLIHFSLLDWLVLALSTIHFAHNTLAPPHVRQTTPIRQSTSPHVDLVDGGA